MKKYLLMLFVLMGVCAMSAEVKTKKVMVALGDSITFGHCGGTVLQEETWLKVLSVLLDGKYEAINAGVNGNSAREAMARYEKDVLSHHPDLILLEFGGNNNDPYQKQRNVEDAEFQRHLEDFKARLPKGCHVVMITFPPIIDEIHAWRNAPAFKGKSIDKSLDSQRELVRKFAAENGYPLLDLYKLIYDRRHEYIFPDGVHLNPKGQRVLAEALCKLIQAQNWD